MSDFFTDPQRRVRPIAGKSGKRGAGLVTAAALTVALGAFGGGTTGAGGAASVGTAGDVAAVRSLRADTAKSQRAARRGRATEAWRRIRVKQVRRAVREETRCARHSFGQVQRFFLRTPCRSLTRVLLVLADRDGNVMVVAVAWVRMRRTADARRFKRLEDTDGTGDISPIAGPALALRSLRFTGTHYDSRRDGRLVVVAEAEPVRGHPADPLLDAVTQVAVELPPP